jgi:hypothetical protein
MAAGAFIGFTNIDQYRFATRDKAGGFTGRNRCGGHGKAPMRTAIIYIRKFLYSSQKAQKSKSV